MTPISTNGPAASKLPGPDERRATRVARRRWFVLGVAALAAPVVLRADPAPPPPPPDSDLLEFLGSDDDNPDLQQYASRQDAPPADAERAPHARSDEP